MSKSSGTQRLSIPEVAEIMVSLACLYPRFTVSLARTNSGYYIHLGYEGRTAIVDTVDRMATINHALAFIDAVRQQAVVA